MKTLLTRVENDILQIKRRLVYLTEIEKELASITGGRKATFKNDIIYQMTLDSYDMVVIDLASLCRWMMGRGGFFNQLNNHLKKFKRASPKKIKPPQGVIVEDAAGLPLSEDDYKKMQNEIANVSRNIIAKNLNDSYDRLFPSLPPRRRSFPFCFLKNVQPNDRVTQAHIEALKNRFERLTEAIIKDRDSRRAHRYEKRKTDFQIERLSFKKIQEQFETVESIVNDVRALTIGGEFIYRPPFLATKERVAQDVADMILLGSIQMIFNKFGVPDEIGKLQPKKKYYIEFRNHFYLKAWRKKLVDTIKRRP